MQPSRGNLLVKPIETQEVVNGIVLLEETRQRWCGQQCEVLEVGEAAFCDDDDCERSHLPSIYVERRRGEPHRLRTHTVRVSAGDWLVVKPRSYTATDVDDVWVVRQDDVLARLVLAE